MSVRETIWALEQEMWEVLSSEDSAAFYRERLTDDAMMTVPSPFGIMTREVCIKAVEEAPSINHYHIEKATVLELTPQSGIVIYSMTQQRPGQERFRAAISSVYVMRDDVWKMAFHQQTPLS